MQRAHLFRMTLVIRGRLLVFGAGLLQLGVLGSGGSSLSVRYTSNTATPHDVFVVAHEDDWQLFMGDVVAKRIKAGHSATFVYLTAGDDGRDSLYWQTRERAALQSTRAAIGPAAADSNAISCSSAIYHGWQDLKATVSNLISPGSASAEIVVHANDPSVPANPHDHFDHRMAGLLVNDLRNGQKWNTEYYVGYALATRAANRSADDAREKTAIFLAYDKEMIRVNKAWSAYAEHPAFYSECMLRTYARKARASRSR